MCYLADATRFCPCVQTNYIYYHEAHLSFWSKLPVLCVEKLYMFVLSTNLKPQNDRKWSKKESPFWVSQLSQRGHYHFFLRKHYMPNGDLVFEVNEFLWLGDIRFEHGQVHQLNPNILRTANNNVGNMRGQQSYNLINYKHTNMQAVGRSKSENKPLSTFLRTWHTRSCNAQIKL